MRARPGGAPILLKDCYNFDPRNGRDKNDVKHIKGINLCMWAEWIPSGELLMYMTYPPRHGCFRNRVGQPQEPSKPGRV